MNPMKVSAMFAAYVWFISRHGDDAAAEKEAAAFARANWQAFLASAHKGLGRLLLRIAKVDKRSSRGPGKTAELLVG